MERKVAPNYIHNKNEHQFVFKKEGYHDYVTRQQSSLSPFAPYLWYSTLGLSALIDVPVGAHRIYPKTQFATLSVDQVREILKTQYVRDTVFVQTGSKSQAYHYQKSSDVDRDVPEINSKYENRFSLIIGNEDYKSHQTDLTSEVNVKYARNDASAFKEYSIKTLGIPEPTFYFI